MTDRKAMQMALDTLEQSRVFVTTREKIKHPEGTGWYDERTEAIRAALAQGEQEPFGYFKAEPFGWTDCAETDEGAIPLYERPVAPPQREWRGLTDEERQECLKQGIDYGWIGIADAVEAKLKEKNK